MTNIKWISGKLVNQSVINKLEHDLEIDLPTDYKAIISEFNGGSPIPQTFNIGAKNGFELNALLDIASEPVNEVLVTFKVIAERSNKKMVPFASDSFGNYLCFDYSKEGTHEVVFWEHDSNKIFVICDSLTELLNQLY